MNRSRNHEFVVIDDCPQFAYQIEQCNLCGIVRKKYPAGVSCFQDEKGNWKSKGVPLCPGKSGTPEQEAHTGSADSIPEPTPAPIAAPIKIEKEKPVEFQRSFPDLQHPSRGVGRPSLLEREIPIDASLCTDIAREIFVKAVVGSIRGPLPLSEATIEEIAEDSIIAAKIFVKKSSK